MDLCGVQGSISSLVYEQLLRAQIPKVQKKTDNLIAFFALLGSEHVKAARRRLVKSTTGSINVLWAAFSLKIPKAQKDSQAISVFF